jgi:hypothetical protein
MFPCLLHPTLKRPTCCVVSHLVQPHFKLPNGNSRADLLLVTYLSYALDARTLENLLGTPHLRPKSEPKERRDDLGKSDRSARPSPGVRYTLPCFLFVSVYLVLCLISVGQPFKDRAQCLPQSLTGRTAISTSVCYLDSFINTVCCPFPPRLFVSFCPQLSGFRSRSRHSSIPFPYKAQGCPTANTTSTQPTRLITHLLSSCPLRYVVACSVGSGTSAHPTQPDSFQLGGNQDAQQVVSLVVIGVYPFTYR